MKKLKCLKEDIRNFALSLGFESCGFTQAREIPDSVAAEYASWIEQRKNGALAYMEKYIDVRNDPRLLLDGAKSIIALALNYYPSQFQAKHLPQFAYYAYGKDYHDVVKNKLFQLSAYINEKYGASSRACVDTAPLRERYWAQQAGIGFIGRNNQLILPGKGSYFFLGFLISSLDITPDEPCLLTCGNCRRCVAYCPSKALSDEGALDARKCLSACTIEFRGDFDPDLKLGNHIYGCDICQKACFHNRNAMPSAEPLFQPSPEFLNLSKEDISQMTDLQFRSIFRNSAVRRIKLDMLKRNLAHLD